MRVFLYEAITGGGWFRMAPHEALPGSLLREGRAMARALRDDLLRIPGCQLQVLADERAAAGGCPWWREGLGDLATRMVGHEVRSPQDHGSEFDRLVQSSDRVILIAPELDGMLADLAGRVEELGGNLRSPSRDFVALSADKCHLASVLAAAGVSTPLSHRICSRTVAAFDWETIVARSNSWVLKPNDGAGSQGILRLAGNDVRREVSRVVARDPDRVWCLQEYHRGRAASVAAILDGSRWMLLPPCWQWLDEGTFAYCGGALMEDPEWAGRAWRVAEQTIRAMPATQGYVGMDVVLAEDSAGGSDVLIEVNPRLTTSYVGLRQAVVGNLAQGMLEGLEPGLPRYCHGRARVQFDAEGAWRIAEEGGRVAPDNAGESGA